MEAKYCTGMRPRKLLGDVAPNLLPQNLFTILARGTSRECYRQSCGRAAASQMSHEESGEMGESLCCCMVCGGMVTTSIVPFNTTPGAACVSSSPIANRRRKALRFGFLQGQKQD
jgi:hypothetical protein